MVLSAVSVQGKITFSDNTTYDLGRASGEFLLGMRRFVDFRIAEYAVRTERSMITRCAVPAANVSSDCRLRNRMRRNQQQPSAWRDADAVWEVPVLMCNRSCMDVMRP